MGYFLRVLGINNPDIHVDELINALKEEGLTAKFSLLEGEQADKWTVLEIANNDGTSIAQIEKNSVSDGELGFEELEEFRSEIEDCKPLSAVKWLDSYFKSVKVIYAFQTFDAAFEDENYVILSTIRSKIWNETGGILQADGEGFSNDEGYHILWQFSGTAQGPWACAVLDPNGNWQNFCMELSDTIQRDEFLEGKVPATAEVL